jgi:thiosulfate/3-mercaptopyruvate sulfurtransferase
MKKKLFVTLVAFMLGGVLLAGGTAFAKKTAVMRDLAPIVSTAWLYDNLSLENLVILDIRSVDAYDAGHIPGAVSEPFVVPFSAWITMRDGLLLEVPDKEDLFAAIGNLGITADSWVVVVTSPNPGEPPHYGLANGTRVACTLIYAGIANVAILDGGYPKWVADGYETTDEVPAIDSVIYEGILKQRMFVTVDYVHRNLKRSDILDGRDADVYYGEIIEPFALKAGHIPGAISLPTPWLWNLQEGDIYTFKDVETLGKMARGALRQPWGKMGHFHQKTIVYCGVGGYASSLWFVLTQVLGYDYVMFFDGSAQEWVTYYDMVPYQWD